MPDQVLPAPVLTCPRCGARLEPDGSALACAGGHRYADSGDYCDLYGEETPQRSVGLFDGIWGRMYDRGIKDRRTTPWLNRLWQGSSAAHLREMYRLMDEGVTCAEDEIVVDVPVGGGPALVGANGRLKGRYVGVDLSREQLQRAARMRERVGVASNVTLVRGSAFALPLATGSVDGVLTFNGLHLMEDKERVLGELHRVLRPGGRIVGSTLVLDPSRRARLLRPWFFCPRVVPTVPDSEIERIARETGFEAWEQSRSGPLLVFRGRRGGAPGGEGDGR